MWDIRGDQEIKQYKPPTPNSSFTSVATSLSGRLLLASSDDSTIHMWDITGTHLGNLGGHENRITQVATILEFQYFDEKLLLEEASSAFSLLKVGAYYHCHNLKWKSCLVKAV